MQSIFKKQSELLKKYKIIEQQNKIPTIDKFDPDSHLAQYKLKDYFWRITEELGEFYLQYEKSNNSPETLEELSDVIHFLAETTIYLSTYFKDLKKSVIQQFKKFKPNNYAIDFLTFRMILKLTEIADKYLKNKPWKQTPIKLTKQQLKNFKNEFLEVWNYLFLLISNLYDIKKIEDLYFKKALKNDERINSKY